MAGDASIAFKVSPESDPDGSKLRRFVAAHLACERARAARELFLLLWAGASILIWPAAAWPHVVPPAARTLALILWAGFFLGYAFATALEWTWRRRREQSLAGVEPPVGDLRQHRAGPE